MTTQDLKQIQLYRQHLTDAADKLTVARDLNGVQCQFLSYALHALRTRCSQEITAENFEDGLVKNWTVRGTVHVFAREDLAVFKHKGAESDYLSHRWDGVMYRGSWWITPERQEYFARFIVAQVASGTGEREQLKTACCGAGMTERERSYIFDGWGGLLRQLCERGFLSCMVREKKAFAVCTPFTPMRTEDALLEQARRYLTHFAPATVKDMAYYFGWTQTFVKKVIAALPVNTCDIDGKTYYYLGALRGDYPAIPRCLLVAGFDQLMLGYQKNESIYLPGEHLRGIFNLAGIVLPPILLDGRVVGRWRKKDSQMTFELFEKVTAPQRKFILSAMDESFGDIKKVVWSDVPCAPKTLPAVTGRSGGKI
jgi:hypothetical protein